MSVKLIYFTLIFFEINNNINQNYKLKVLMGLNYIFNYMSLLTWIKRWCGIKDDINNEHEPDNSDKNITTDNSLENSSDNIIETGEVKI